MKKLFFVLTSIGSLAMAHDFSKSEQLNLDYVNGQFEICSNFGRGCVKVSSSTTKPSENFAVILEQINYGIKEGKVKSINDFSQKNLIEMASKLEENARKDKQYVSRLEEKLSSCNLRYFDLVSPGTGSAQPPPKAAR